MRSVEATYVLMIFSSIYGASCTSAPQCPSIHTTAALASASCRSRKTDLSRGIPCPENTIATHYRNGWNEIEQFPSCCKIRAMCGFRQIYGQYHHHHYVPLHSGYLVRRCCREMTALDLMWVALLSRNPTNWAVASGTLSGHLKRQ